MNQTLLFRLSPFILALALIFISCQKEVSEENTNTNNGGSGGSNSSFTSGWSYTNGSTNLTGCIDTAYYETINGAKFFAVEGTDVMGNGFIILVATTGGKLSATTYTAAQGAALLVEDENGNQYISGTTPSSFSFTVTSITDTSITGTFTGSLTDGISATPYVVTNGSIKALIGKPNTCTQTGSNTGGGTGGTGGSGTGGTGTGGTGSGGTGGSGTGADYVLVSSASSCSEALIQGDYNKGVALTSTNKITLKVNVTKTGSWSVTTDTENGMKFSGSGNFTTTGVQTIVLAGSGTPEEAESTGFSVLAGTSDCMLYVPVITAGTAPCNPPNNTADFASLRTVSFSSPSYSASSSQWDGYTIIANGSGGDLKLTFYGQSQPKPGVYKIEPVGVVDRVDEVSVYAVASNILWQPSEGSLYVTVNNGKVTAIMCDVPIIGSLGGPSFNSKLTAKITEQ